MIGCRPGGGCCTACAEQSTPFRLTAPIGLDGFGLAARPRSSFGFVEEAIAIAEAAAKVVAATKSIDQANTAGNAVAAQSADQQAVAILSAQQTSSIPAVLKSPAALAGIGAVAIALLMSR